MDIPLLCYSRQMVRSNGSLELDTIYKLTNSYLACSSDKEKMTLESEITTITSDLLINQNYTLITLPFFPSC